MALYLRHPSAKLLFLSILIYKYFLFIETTVFTDKYIVHCMKEQERRGIWSYLGA